MPNELQDPLAYFPTTLTWVGPATRRSLEVSIDEEGGWFGWRLGSDAEPPAQANRVSPHDMPEGLNSQALYLVNHENWLTDD